MNNNTAAVKNSEQKPMNTRNCTTL